jgi:hypothetical protein
MPYSQNHPFFQQAFLQAQAQILPPTATNIELIAVLNHFNLLARLLNFLEVTQDQLLIQLVGANKLTSSRFIKTIHDNFDAQEIDQCRARFNTLLSSFRSIDGHTQIAPYNPAACLYSFIAAAVKSQILDIPGNIFENTATLITVQLTDGDLAIVGNNRWEQRLENHQYAPELKDILLAATGLAPLPIIPTLQ